jgi:hypothetical protein
MHERFASVVEKLHPLFIALVEASPYSNGPMPLSMPQQGVYLFSESGKHLYAGRSNHMRRRYGQHSNPGSQHNQAVFAFRLARESTGQTTAAYTSGDGSRKWLAADPSFSEAFASAKARVRNMDFRFVEVTDQTHQALLELYAAIALGCPYNDFNTH